MVEMNDDLRTELVEVVWDIVQATLGMDSYDVSVSSHQKQNSDVYVFKAELGAGVDFSSDELNKLQDDTVVEFDNTNYVMEFDGIDTQPTHEIVFTVKEQS